MDSVLVVLLRHETAPPGNGLQQLWRVLVVRIQVLSSPAVGCVGMYLRVQPSKYEMVSGFL